MPNSYNDGGENVNLDFAPPVLPEVIEVPPMMRELNQEFNAEPSGPVTDASGLHRLADMQRKVRDLEL